MFLFASTVRRLTDVGETLATTGLSVQRATGREWTGTAGHARRRLCAWGGSNGDGERPE